MKKLNYILILIGILTLNSCQEAVTDTGLQDDPNTFSSAPAVNILGNAELQLTLIHGSDMARYSGILTNQITGLSAQWSSYNNYDLTQGDFDGIWDGIYHDGITQVQLVKEAAIESENIHLLASAEILEAFFIGELAAFFGDIPYTEVNNATNILNPNFDSQRDVLITAIELLDSAISKNAINLYFLIDDIEDESEIGGLTTSSSLNEIANSLKARFYLILEDYPNALVSAQQGIQSSDGDLIADSFTTSTFSENLFYQFGVDQREGNIGAVDSYLYNMLTSASRNLTTPGDTERASFYYTLNDFNYTDGIFAETANSNILSWYETKLIEAEATERINAGSGLAPFNEVRAALALEYTGTFPNSSATGDELLLDILEEKYITMFPNPAVFHDIQRTDNFIGITIKSGNNLPKRFLYPESETNSNSNAPGTIPDLFTATPINQ